VYGRQVGALLKTTAHPLPTSITGATLQDKVPIVTLHPDDPTPLAGNAYDRTDMGVYVIAKNPTGGKLYGFSATNGNWMTSTDGITWTDQGRQPETDFGSKAVSIVFSGSSWWVTALDGKLWSGTVDTFNAWTNVTPAEMPANTIGSTSTPPTMARSSSTPTTG
jgi:hypothetical protein